MRLQWKLFLLFALLVTLPLTTTALVTRATMRAGFEEYYEVRLRQTDQAVRLVYSDFVRDEQTRLASLCDGDPFLDAALVEIARLRPTPQLRSRLQAWVTRQAKALNLETLDVLGQKGVVLASAHYPGRRGEKAPRLMGLTDRADGRAVIALVTRHERGVGERESLTLLTSCQASQAGEELRLLGGRLVDETLADRISSRLSLGDVRVFILDAERNPIQGSDESSAHVGEMRRLLVPLVNTDDDSTPAWLAIGVDDSRERRALQKLDRSTLLIVLIAIAAAWLLGMIVARNIGRPLARLSEQARIVASGELGGTVDVKASGEVRELVDAFNRMSIDLEDSRDRLVQAERIAAWRDIARRIAHEIKNPLFPIQTSIETVRKAYRKQHPEFEEIFDEATVMILEEVERLKRIVTEFSRFARLPKPAPEYLEVEEAIGSVVSIYRGQDVDVVANIPDGLPGFNADREQLTQVLHNLIQNAIDAVSEHKPSAPCVEIGATERPGGIVIAIRDNGMGMDDETRGRIFEP